MTNEEGAQELSIYFYDKPEDFTTVTVPSFEAVKALVPGITADIDTYFLRDADMAAQDENFPEETRREATADTTKLDMTNTAKIQIEGVSPIIDEAIETELVFGDEMVITDGTNHAVMGYAEVCGSMQKKSWEDSFYCNDTHRVLFRIPNTRTMTAAEISNLTFTYEDAACTSYRNVTSLNYVEGGCYAYSAGVVKTERLGAFSGYKLKLTNFSSDKFNYIGWNAFAYSEIVGKAVTIDGDAFAVHIYSARGGNVRGAGRAGSVRS